MSLADTVRTVSKQAFRIADSFQSDFVLHNVTGTVTNTATDLTTETVATLALRGIFAADKEKRLNPETETDETVTFDATPVLAAGLVILPGDYLIRTSTGKRFDIVSISIDPAKATVQLTVRGS